MKEVLKINFNLLYNWIEDDIFRNEKIWESKHALDTMWHTHCILDAHYNYFDLNKVASERKHLLEDNRVILNDVLK